LDWKRAEVNTLEQNAAVIRGRNRGGSLGSRKAGTNRRERARSRRKSRSTWTGHFERAEIGNRRTHPVDRRRSWRKNHRLRRNQAIIGHKEVKKRDSTKREKSREGKNNIYLIIQVKKVAPYLLEKCKKMTQGGGWGVGGGGVGGEVEWRLVSKKHAEKKEESRLPRSKKRKGSGSSKGERSRPRLTIPVIIEKRGHKGK